MHTRNIKNTKNGLYLMRFLSYKTKNVLNDHLLTSPSVFENQVQTAFWMIIFFNFHNVLKMMKFRENGT